MHYRLVKTSGMDLYMIFRYTIMHCEKSFIIHIHIHKLIVVHLITKLTVIVSMITAITGVVLDVNVSIKQVVEAQNATESTTDSAGNTSWILDKITSVIANRIPYQ